MRCLAFVVLAACGGSPKAAPGPTLEADPPQAMPALPQSFDTEFAAAVSAPSGEPIKVALFAPAPGLRRTRTIDKLFTVDEDLGEGAVFQQRTTTRFVLREEILAAADATIAKLQVEAELADERVELRGKPHQMQLLMGTYVIAPGERILKITRPAGMDPGSREVEELVTLYAEEVGVPYAPIAVIATKTLRLGEVIALGADDLQRLGGDTPVSLSLIALDGGVATYQFVSRISEPYAFDQKLVEHVGNKASIAIEIATGRVLREEFVALRFVEDRSIKRSRRTTKLDYAR